MLPIIFLALFFYAILNELIPSIDNQMIVLFLPLVAWIIGYYEGFDFGKLINLPNFLFFIFTFFIGLSTLSSVSLLRSTPLFFLFVSFYAFFQIFLLTAKESNLRWIATLIMVIAIGLSLFSFYFLLPGVSLSKNPMSLIYAQYGHSHLADYLILAIPINFVVFLKAKDRTKEIRWGILLIFYCITLFLTFSRGAWVALAITLIILLFLAKTKKNWKKLLAWFLIISPFLIIISFSLLSFQNKLFIPKENQSQNWLVKQVIKPQFYSGRIEYWRQAWQGFLFRPMTGWGWGTFNIVGLQLQNAPERWSSYSHNFYLQVLVETGIFGFMAMFAFILTSFIHIWRFTKRSSNPLIIGCFGSILASTFHSFLDYDWHFPLVFISFLFLLANLLVFSLKKRKENRSSKILLYIPLFLCLLFFVLHNLGMFFLANKDYRNMMIFSPWLAYSTCKSAKTNFNKKMFSDNSIRSSLIILSVNDPILSDCIADLYLSENNKEKALFFLKNKISLQPLENIRDYKKLQQIYEETGRTDKIEEIHAILVNELSQNLPVSFFNQSYGKYFYNIGKSYLDENRTEKTIYWWKQTTRFMPDLSYPYIDLASLFISLNKKDEARKILKECIKFKYPESHCKEYLNKMDNGKSFEAPGSWQEKISRIPDL